MEDEPPANIPKKPPSSAVSQSVLSLTLLSLPTASSLSTPIAPNPKRLTSATHSKSSDAGIVDNSCA